MNTTKMITIGLIVAGLSFGPGAWAKTSPQKQHSEQEEVDYINLAALMVRDGHYARAQEMLSKVSLDQEGLDLKTYHTVQGLIQKQQGQWDAAIRSLKLAKQLGQDDLLLHFYLAQCHYGLQSWRASIHEIQLAKSAGSQFPQAFLMKANAHLKLGEKELAWLTLNSGHKTHPKEPEFLRQKTYLLIELGLYQEASALAIQTLEQIEPTPADYLSLAMAFKKGAQQERAKALLEIAHLKFPKHKQITLHLSHLYIDSGHLLAAGDLLQLGAHKDPELIQEAAEVLKRAQAYNRAIYMNAQVVDQKKKLKQRVAILVQQQRFEELASLDTRLGRLGLLQEDQNILYALAYALFKTHDFPKAQTYLSQLTDPTLFGHASQIRRMISICTKSPELCS